MMRSLWTAASGMIGQQTALDVTANNLSNINTTGYKTQSTNFKSLIYQNLQRKSTTSTGEPKPIGAQVGLGTRVGSISSDMQQGAFGESHGQFDFAIQGEGFFSVKLVDGSTAYTRNGHFTMAIDNDGGTTLTDSDGNPVLDTSGNIIHLEEGYRTDLIQVDVDGKLSYVNDEGERTDLGMQIGLTTFPNEGGLDKISGSNYAQSDASGEPTSWTALALGSKIKSGYLEMSNVNAADEMVNMIITQRAYEMNAKAITASDEMLQQANNLRS
ncbi:MAG: flagellar hook-basal body protein [Eubacterium sp.]|nr:flagellar hook-basal body protein [Eubacterium sp.]